MVTLQDGPQLTLAIVLHPKLHIPPREASLDSELGQALPSRVRIPDVLQQPILQHLRLRKVKGFALVRVGGVSRPLGQLFLLGEPVAVFRPLLNIIQLPVLWNFALLLNCLLSVSLNGFR